MDLQFIPRKRVVEALEQGFRLVPGHEYDPLDWAILMRQSEPQQIVSTAELRQLSAILKAIHLQPSFDEPVGNASRGARSAHYTHRMRRQVVA